MDGGDTSGAKDSAPRDGGVCAWPERFNPTSDASVVGCWAHTISGAADGGQFSCSSSEYALDCMGDIQRFDSGCQMKTMPGPDSSLGCRVLPLPTPPNVLYYCCPCGESQRSLADASVSMSSGCP